MPGGAGLRRFVDPPPVAFASRKPERLGEACELCGTPIGDEHRHVVNVQTRRLLCSCIPCALLFTAHGAGSGNFRAVPDRYVRTEIDDVQWERLQVPVAMAFFFYNSVLGRVVAQYPSPAGATESLLDLSAWDSIVEQNDAVATLEPDVEAFVVRRALDRTSEAYLVPVDICYELVGLLRMHWTGFDGGPEARQDIAEFFERIRARARPLVRAGDG